MGNTNSYELHIKTKFVISLPTLTMVGGVDRIVRLTLDRDAEDEIFPSKEECYPTFGIRPNNIATKTLE